MNEKVTSTENETRQLCNVTGWGIDSPFFCFLRCYLDLRFSVWPMALNGSNIHNAFQGD